MEQKVHVHDYISEVVSLSR